MIDEGVLTAEEIARVAGVARGTVADWRRRHADFPAPVSGTGRAPVFNRAEAEAWLAGAGRWELAPGARLWREVNHAASGTSLGEVVAAVAAYADGQALEHDLPASLAWVAGRAVDEAGAVTVLGDLIDRYCAVSGQYVTPARIAELMVSLAGIGEDATVLDPVSGTGELLAAALAQGAGRVLAQDASADAAALARTRLLAGDSERAEVAVGESPHADAFAGIEADAVLCCPLRPADGSEPELAWAQYALAHLRPGGHAVLLLPESATANPAGARIRADLLRDGSLRAVIELPPCAGWPGSVPPHLWVLRRPDPAADPDLRALFAAYTPDRQAGPDEAAAPTAVEAMPTAQWRGFTSTVERTWRLLNNWERRTILSGGGRNASFCVTWVADLLDDTLLSQPERLGEAFAIAPARVRAHFSAVARVRDAENAAARRRSGIPDLKSPAHSLMRARLSLSRIPLDIDQITKTLQHFDWLDPFDLREPEAREPEAWRPPADWQPKIVQPADPWRTATVPELARLGMLRYRRAGSAPADLLRIGDVLVPATLTDNAKATVVNKKQESDPVSPGVHLIRPNPAHLAPWFLAGFLGAAARQQAAGASAPRIDVRQLEVPLLSLEDQERYAMTFRKLRTLENAAVRLTNEMTTLTSQLTTALTVGEIRPQGETAS